MRRGILLCFALGVVLRASAFIDISLQMQLGNPSAATPDTNNHSHYLIQRSIEALDYNDNRGQANWASWDLTSGDANGAVARQDSYAADKSLPPNFYKVAASEYSLSGFDRGHLCPSADRTDSTNDNDMTFLMSNMMPQAPDNNRITWNHLESYCQTLADVGNEILITCGPSGFDGSTLSSSSHIFVPSNTWKIAVVVPLGVGTALSRITTTTNRVIAVIVPNTNGVSANWSNYVTSVHEIELRTGLTFFSALPGTIASAFRAKIDNLSNPPPQMVSFIPITAAPNIEVIITGTNFNGTVSVKFNGADAVFTVNSNTQIVTTVPQNATSGLIQIITPGGTATSIDNFAVLPTDVAPVLSLPVFSNNQFQFMVNGATGHNYAVEGSANLTNWVSILTNSVPFLFSDSSSTHRFYRAHFIQ